MITKQKHPSPCFPQELSPGQEEAAGQAAVPQTRTRGGHSHNHSHGPGPGGAAPWHGGQQAPHTARLAAHFTMLPAGSLRNKHSLPLLQHTENRGTACCWSSPSSSAGSPPLGPPALIGDARVAAAPPSRAGLAGPSVKAGPCLRRLPCLRAQRSRQRQILQLLQLAQAASDYLKPQPFFYERRAQTLDRSIFTCSDGSRDH